MDTDDTGVNTTGNNAGPTTLQLHIPVPLQPTNEALIQLEPTRIPDTDDLEPTAVPLDIPPVQLTPENPTPSRIPDTSFNVGNDRQINRPPQIPDE